MIALLCLTACVCGVVLEWRQRFSSLSGVWLSPVTVFGRPAARKQLYAERRRGRRRRLEGEVESPVQCSADLGLVRLPYLGWDADGGLKNDHG